TVDAKIAEEIQQFNDMGGAKHAGEYVAQNFVSAIKHTVEAFGLDGQIIEESREQFIEDGKAFDREIQDIRETLQAQQGELPSSPIARSQDIRLQKKIASRPQTDSQEQQRETLNELSTKIFKAAGFDSDKSLVENIINMSKQNNSESR
ncbi:MAG: hypothetical protein NC218_04240, partial [Acetobacter sp.]|nr:hypothetical protein [Acetobacter sp.]